MRKLAAVVHAALGAVLLRSSVAKLVGAAGADRNRLAIAAWFWVVAGVIELVGALGLLAGLKFRRLALPAALWVAALTVGALSAHIRAGDAPAAMLLAVLVLGTALALAASHPNLRGAMTRLPQAPAGGGD